MSDQRKLGNMLNQLRVMESALCAETHQNANVGINDHKLTTQIQGIQEAMGSLELALQALAERNAR